MPKIYNNSFDYKFNHQESKDFSLFPSITIVITGIEFWGPNEINEGGFIIKYKYPGGDGEIEFVNSQNKQLKITKSEFGRMFAFAAYRCLFANAVLETK